MTINQKQRFFDNGVEKIIAEMPDGLSDLEKARYIYISLGKLLCFDEKYMYSKAKLGRLMYVKAKNDVPSFSDIQEGRRKRMVCVSTTKLFNSVLKEIGITATSVQEDYSDKHESTSFMIGDRVFKADLTADLKFIHLNLPTRHFAVLKPNTLSPEELYKIDSTIGYDYTGKDAINSAMTQLASELLSHRQLGSKVSRVLEVASQIPKVKDLNYIERDSFYDYMLTHLISSKDRVRLSKNVLYKQIHEDRFGFIPLYSTCDYDNLTNSAIFRRFMFSEEDKKFIEISDDELQKFINDGNYHLSGGKKIPGLNKRSNKSLDKKNPSSEHR